MLTGMDPHPTSATTRDVVVDDDCIRVVARIPTNSPTSGLEALLMTLPTTPPPNILKEDPSKPMLTMKMYSRATRRRILPAIASFPEVELLDRRLLNDVLSSKSRHTNAT